MRVTVLALALKLQKVRRIGRTGKTVFLWKLEKALKNTILWSLHRDKAIRSKT